MKSRMEKSQSRIDTTFWLSIPVLFILPFLCPYTAVATNILIMALFAIGYNLLLGYTGLLSFGHASFFGLGAYGTGLLMVHLDTPFWVAMICGVSMAAVGGVVIGFLALRRSDVYFALLTLAFSQILYFLALQMRALTGGDDGLSGVPVVHLPPFVDLSKPMHMYYFALILFVVAAYLARMLLRSPFGKAMQAVKENESRAIACGYRTQTIKLIAFVISATFGGLAGALYCVHLRFVPLETFHWLTNGEVIFVSIVGGVGTFFGPIVGSAAFILLQDTMQRLLERWELIVGVILILFILFFNQGIVGFIENAVASYKEKRTTEVAGSRIGGGS
jgi:branched-chain amino acid transport system permease protein